MAFHLLAVPRKFFLGPTAVSEHPATDILFNISKPLAVRTSLLSIMGSIALGFATPDEAAGVGVIATIIVGRFLGNLDPEERWSKAFLFGDSTLRVDHICSYRSHDTSSGG